MMNQSADPCEDFHNYVCGNFQMTHEPFEDMTRTMSFEMLRRENNFILHNVLKKMSKSTGMRRYYKHSCFDSYLYAILWCIEVLMEV